MSVIVFRVVLTTSSNLTFGIYPFRHIMRHIVVVVVVIVLNDTVCVSVCVCVCVWETSVGHACSSFWSWRFVLGCDLSALVEFVSGRWRSSPSESYVSTYFCMCFFFFRWLTSLFLTCKDSVALLIFLSVLKKLYFSLDVLETIDVMIVSHTAFQTSDDEFEKSSGLV